MSRELAALIGNILHDSDFLKSIESVKGAGHRSRLFKNSVRNLTADEIEQLKSQGNSSDDWSTILVAERFNSAGVFHSSFIGSCCLGVFDGASRKIVKSINLRPGIYRTTVIDSEIGDNCTVYDAGILSNYIVSDNSVILQTGSIAASDSCTFGNGIEIAVGNETGGREILSYADLTIPVAEAVAKNRGDGGRADDA